MNTNTTDLRVTNKGKHYMIIKKFIGSKPVGTILVQTETCPHTYSESPEYYQEVTDSI